ncbi:LCP family protein [Peterkaempfera sp. SMS 1(5)a]|uniref:LCP family protein n=1 Tax=Peterkaempfera podocarpi TaxID=3232308 RepID=UPI00366E428C
MSAQDRPTPPENTAAPGRAAPDTPASIPRQRGAGPSRRRPKSGWKRFIKPVAIGTAVTVAAGCGGVYLYIQHLNSNITKAPKSAGNSAPPGGKADAQGRTAMNILLIGTDSRKGLGGKYGDKENVGKGNNDVDILLHVYPDRKSAVAVDLPRDTLVNHPPCTDPVTKQVYGPMTRMPLNMALSRGGPGCVVDTVQKITDLRIDHFLMVNFEGVKDLTNAVGGVDVNLCQPIHDSDSHLDLPAGPSHLDGDQGLAFVRTRHAVQDGSAVGRFSMQRAFLASLFRQMTSAGTLLNPTKLTPLAEAATKALTVDPDLGSVTALTGLADDLKAIKPDKVAFLQPKVSYTPRDLADPNRSEKDEFVQPQADQIFAMLLADRSLTGKPAAKPASASASPTHSAEPTVVPSQVTVTVLNGTTTRNGAASVGATALTALGYHATSGNAPQKGVQTSTVTYAQADQQAAAQSVARSLGLPASAVKVGGTGRGVVVTIGADFPQTIPTAKPSIPVPTALPTDVKVHKADDTSCTSKGNGLLTQ